jgi:hypothetical protein
MFASSEWGVMRVQRRLLAIICLAVCLCAFSLLLAKPGIAAGQYSLTYSIDGAPMTAALTSGGLFSTSGGLGFGDPAVNLEARAGASLMQNSLLPGGMRALYATPATGRGGSVLLARQDTASTKTAASAKNAASAQDAASTQDSLQALYSAYLREYVGRNGRVISNHGKVDWCPNSCIGCDADTTSEGIARLAHAAALIGDKQTFDVANSFAATWLRDRRTGFLMWKLDASGRPGSCGGANSAVDAELIMIGALLDAQQRWGGVYAADARSLMGALKPGVVNGSYLPSCLQDQSGHTVPCSQTVFMGYLDLPVLKRMCALDPYWCGVHERSKALLIAAVQGNGVYSTYYLPSGGTPGRWAWENADIQPNLVLKQLATDGDADAWAAVKPLYDEGRGVFLANRAQGKSEICQEFNPETGCKIADAPLRVYANYLEMAVARHDTAFADELRKYIDEKLATLPSSPLAGQDNYGNIVVIEALARKT